MNDFRTKELSLAPLNTYHGSGICVFPPSGLRCQRSQCLIPRVSCKVVGRDMTISRHVIPQFNKTELAVFARAANNFSQLASATIEFSWSCVDKESRGRKDEYLSGIAFCSGCVPTPLGPFDKHAANFDGLGRNQQPLVSDLPSVSPILSTTSSSGPCMCIASGIMYLESWSVLGPTPQFDVSLKRCSSTRKALFPWASDCALIYGIAIKLYKQEVPLQNFLLPYRSRSRCLDLVTIRRKKH